MPGTPSDAVADTPPGARHARRGAARRRLAAAGLVAAGLLVASTAAGAADTRVSAQGLSLAAHLETGAGGDIAFWGDIAVVLNNALDADISNDGFTVVDIEEPTEPRVLSRFPCVGSAYDVGVWRDLVVLSVDLFEQKESGRACGPRAPDEQPFLGIRILSIEDPTSPRWLADVPTPNGSHTNTLLPDLAPTDGSPPRLIVYSNNGYDPMTSQDPRGLQSVVEVPLRDPAAARRLTDAMPYTPAAGHLPEGAAPGRTSFNTPPNLGCHDLSVFVPRRLATCSGLQPDTQLWDVTDPLRPVLLSTIVNPAVEHHHSTAFSWDGQTLVLVEESVSNQVAGLAGGRVDRCRTDGSSPKAALWFYDVSDPRAPVLRSWFQAEQEANDDYCTPHYFNVVPLESGRDVLVASWGGAGTTVVDFTDPARPTQLAHHTVLSDDRDERSFSYASYWHNGYVYVNNGHGVLPGLADIGGSRGLDVLRLDVDGLDDFVRVKGFSHGTQDCLPKWEGCAPIAG